MPAQTKIAVVTGGSRGLGRDMALSLARNGIDVILTYRSKQEEAEAVVKEIEHIGCKAVALPLDMIERAAIDPFVAAVQNVLQEKWYTDRFDFLINNAGMGATVPFEHVTEALFDDFLNVHFKGVYFLTQKL